VPAKPMVSAVEMGARQREISVSEFFTKNRHLLGFDNPRKALLTCVKEAVDNALDACEEAGILPDVVVRVETVANGEPAPPASQASRFRITVTDNGPGIVRQQIPRIFAKLLYGSKFHRLRMSRGQQGIGISAAGMYGQLTTGKPVRIISRTSARTPAHYFEVEIDTKKNAPVIVKDNPIDVVIGPIETYEDELFGYKAAHEAYVLVKDQEWSRRLSRYITLLPALQRGLPVPAAYKREKPGSDSDLNAYDVVYYAGHANAGSKTIAINLPNDEQVQLKKGTRRLQLKNAMRAKFDRILVPIGKELIADDQQQHIVFDAFFANVMFHEVAHGLGVKNTINGKGTVRHALKEQAGALEEGKADILGLYMITRLRQQGEMPDADLDDNYVTFLAGILRSIRFGAGNAHGRANAAELSYLQERGAFTRDSATGRYRVDFTRMRSAVDSMAGAILRLQGDGDYEGVARFMAERGKIPGPVQSDLDRLGGKGIPVDIVFQQGVDALGLGRQ